MTLEVEVPSQEETGAVQSRFYPEILSEQILSQQGSFRKMEWFLRGWYPRLGTLHFGYTGKETIVKETVIVPVKTFTVQENVLDKEADLV